MHIEFIKAFFLEHLIIPTVLIVLAFLLVYLKKKLPFIRAKELILYLLVGGVLLGLPGLFGFAGNTFNPYWYLIGSILYFLMGCIHLNQIRKRFQALDVAEGLSTLFEVSISVFMLLFGVLLFTYLFDWLSPFKGYALLSASCSITFFIPLLFGYCFNQFLKIPLSIYKTWNYQLNKQPIDFEGFDLSKLKVVTLELSKNEGEGHQFRIQAKTLGTGITFGDWFQKVLEDYNFKNASYTIELRNEEGVYYAWIFYVKRSMFHLRHYIDFELDITQNKIKENDVIICKRVMEHKQQINE
ncbi:hypothetical protein H4K35_03540 [Myroides sp. NP-2]|uniref:TssN family type VI secretion system protein n=1 Tax=Myroides sp. NP-2 TaxID=2759945 RepID=UPI0015FA03E5|nr:TssN family type VI secretion system protein [Myroides sp. NP-2]MBB1149212.1 hypothetical protein [Myroides sp. NP-2]